MASNQERENLLESLKQLFFRVVTLRSESRARSSFNTGYNNDAASPHDIVTRLSEHIEQLAANASSAPANTAPSQIPKTVNRAHDYPPSSQVRLTTDEPSELTQHLKESHKHAGASPDVGARLRQSTWEHLHTAIRFGRQGDVAAAKVHIDLTNSALKESAHYLPEAEYSDFAQEILLSLEQLNNNGLDRPH